MSDSRVVMVIVGEPTTPAEPSLSSTAEKVEEDKQLARLYDYTKFHIGIYLSTAGGLASLIVAIANVKDPSGIVRALQNSSYFLVGGLVAMVLAGACGGCVATSAIECTTYKEFLSEPQRALFIKLGKGRTVVFLEHFFFWISVACLGAVVVLSFPQLQSWLSARKCS